MFDDILQSKGLLEEFQAAAINEGIAWQSQKGDGRHDIVQEHNSWKVADKQCPTGSAP